MYGMYIYLHFVNFVVNVSKCRKVYLPYMDGMGLGLCCLDPCPFVRVASCAKDRKQQSGKSTIADKDKITPDLPRGINTTKKADNKMI